KSKSFQPESGAPKKITEEMARETDVAGEPVSSVEEAVNDCDVVCSATNSSRPVLNPDWLRPAMHYNSIREFETDLPALVRCHEVTIQPQFCGIQHYQPPGVVDDMPGVRREKPRDWSRYPEICDLIAGTVPGRTDDKQITFFLNNVGTGVQFAAMGY